eukprot:4215054-Amphidinium_carterae.1
MGAPEKDMREIFNLLAATHIKIAHCKGTMGAFLMPHSSKSCIDSAACLYDCVLRPVSRPLKAGA